MRTTIVLDDKLIKQAMRLAKAKTMREAVDVALRDYVALAHRRNILPLVGKDLIAPDYDVHAVRRNMRRDPR
jgi:Arc/MetJ family transcription regulator